MRVVANRSKIAAAVLPTGDFLVNAGGWTGLPPSQLLVLLRGSAEVSAGGSPELARLKAALADDPAALATLSQDGDPAATLAGLRALPGETGAAVAGYLDLIGYRLLDGFDICEPAAVEMPDALVRAMRLEVAGREEADLTSVAEKTAEVRALVPAEHQAAFDDLLGEARLTYRLRDERGVYSDIWASGLMRRAAMSAGRRLAAGGRVAQAEHFLDATLDEMVAIVGGAASPTSEELAKWAEYRATVSPKDVPFSLGDPEGPPPDLSALPPAVGRVMAATMVAIGQVFGSSEAQHEDDVLFGLAASPGVYEGPARLIGSPAEFGRIVKGDILVTEATTEAFNILLPLLGAIVTDNGGLLSHSAIVAREYGIPGVVGTREATERIRDGVRLRVDGEAGEVTVLGSKAAGLGEAARLGLPVPPGVALSGDTVEAVAGGEAKATARVLKAVSGLPGPFAVRSSAVDEDGASASFAGQHLTLLNVPDAEAVPAAVREVWWSANSDSAITYRQRVGLFTRPSVGVVVQTLLNPVAAGVMFTENPVTGADERVIEAAWGLGEAVVAGLVIPDHFRVARSGDIVERKAGRKRVAVRSTPDGGTVEEKLTPEMGSRLSLDDAQLQALNHLAARCEVAYGPRRDIEWAVDGSGILYLLQCRAVTTGKARTEADKPPAARTPAQALATVGLFAGLDRKEVEEVSRLLKERRFAKGETVIMEGSGGAALYIIASGTATVTRHGEEVATLDPGAYFGELALIDGGPRSATVTADSDLVCFGLTFWEFRPLVQGNGAIGWKLLETLAKRLRAAEAS